VSPFDAASFLAESGRPAQVASVSPTGNPLLGSLWYLYDRGRFWLSSLAGSPLLVAAQRGAPVAAIVDDFHPPDSIRQVRVRGPARSEPHDPETVYRLYRRHLGPDLQRWPQFFQTRLRDAQWVLWSVSPESGLAVSTPGFRGPERRWHRLADCPLDVNGSQPTQA
jgi:hypothetical protein